MKRSLEQGNHLCFQQCVPLHNSELLVGVSGESVVLCAQWQLNGTAIAVPASLPVHPEC